MKRTEGQQHYAMVTQEVLLIVLRGERHMR